jgi:hypothetical protein
MSDVGTSVCFWASVRMAVLLRRITMRLRLAVCMFVAKMTMSPALVRFFSGVRRPVVVVLHPVSVFLSCVGVESLIRGPTRVNSVEAEIYFRNPRVITMTWATKVRRVW